MKKKSICMLLLAAILLLSSCSSEKTVKTKEGAKELVEEFYAGLTEEDPVTMTTYSSGEQFSVFRKDGEKMHVYYPSEDYGYYLFTEDGVKYVITAQGDLFEDESFYDLSYDTISTVLLFHIDVYFDADDETMSYQATKKGEDELVLTVNGTDEEEFTVTVTGRKENGRITDILSETEYDGQTYSSEYVFTYGETIELPEYTKPVTYNDMPHVESPYQTYGEIIDQLDEDEFLFYTLYDTQLLVIDEKDGRHYQFSSIVDQETYDAFYALDFMADDYEQQVYDLISKIEIEDCIDFTDVIISQSELDAYIGNTVEALVNDGFELNGWSFYEDHNFIYASKDLLTYRADVELPDDFDFDSDYGYEDFYGFTITGISFDSVEYAALPMR